MKVHDAVGKDAFKVEELCDPGCDGAGDLVLGVRRVKAPRSARRWCGAPHAERRSRERPRCGHVEDEPDRLVPAPQVLAVRRQLQVDVRRAVQTLNR